MPYIKLDQRKNYHPELDQLIAKLLSVPEEDRDGHINYCVTWLLKQLYYPPKYKRYNRAMGVLDCIAREYYRRVVAPYEDEKIKENSDV